MSLALPSIPNWIGKKVMPLFDFTFIRQNGNIIFLSLPGVGKVHLAVSLALKACRAGLSICFTTMNDLIIKLKKDDLCAKFRLKSHK